MRGVIGQRAQYVMFREPATGRLLSVTSQPRVLLQWTVQKYPVQVRMSPLADQVVKGRVAQDSVCT